ncbi:hypothetical protein Bpfe_017527 [Biomphalaria pfeifferi]|uniref:TM2 domain-containing protein n=1 Tax=Biomphalaria pfeifferi TaxID=112525 RepID=A0AAD8F6J0_BIOPF|nr:hypothetical protein Bpfe_017527 [Biomphalaria pfeifferi]
MKTSISKKEPPSYSGPSQNVSPGVSFVPQNGVHLSQAQCGPAAPVQCYIPPPQPSNFGPPTNSSPYFINTANTPPYTASLDRSYHTAATRLALLPRKSVLEAYLLAVSPFGILGAHHFYLRRYYWGIVYFFTLGLAGCGYLIDWFRVPFLVKDANEKLQSTDPKVEEKKNLSDAYTLWFPFGLLGFHHYYLGNYAWGAVYTFSGGIFGIGWLVDSIRMPWLVKAANERIVSNPIERNEKNLCPAYALGLTPIGILGGHHYYLNRPLWGVLYTLTLGMVGVGWLFDWIRMPYIVARVNEEVRGKRPPNVKTADDAYILWFVFGLLGFHHFYLGRPLWGLLYFFTLGLFGIGWLVDMCRIPFLVREVNKENEERRRIIASQIEEANRQTVAHVTVTPGYQNYGMVNPGEYPPSGPQTGLYPNYPVAYNYGQGAAAQSYQTAGYDYFAPGQPPSTVIMAEPQPPPYSPREQEAGPLPEKHMV